MQSDRGPQAVAAVARPAVDDDRPGALQPGLERRETCLEFLLGQMNGTGDMAKVVVGPRAHVDEHRAGIVPQRLGRGPGGSTECPRRLTRAGGRRSRPESDQAEQADRTRRPPGCAGNCGVSRDSGSA